MLWAFDEAYRTEHTQHLPESGGPLKMLITSSFLTVVVAEVEPELQEGTVIALACLFGFLFIVLVLSLTCFLVR